MRTYTQEIEGTECIGDSLYTKINPNFQNLDIAVAELSSVVIPGTTTPRALQQRLGTTINVKDFGALGNGITDDTIPIQTAVNYLSGTGGGVLEFDRGVFITGPIYITGDNITIQGRGSSATIVKLRNSLIENQFGVFNFGISENINSIPTYVDTTNVGVQDLAIDGNKNFQLRATDSSAGVNNGINIGTVSRFLGARLVVENCDGVGVAFKGSNLPYRFDQVLEDVDIKNNFYCGVTIEGGADNIPSQIILNRVQSRLNGVNKPNPNFTSCGFTIRGRFVRLTDCFASNNVNDGFRLADIDCFEAILRGCVADTNNENGYNVFQNVDNSVTYSFIQCTALDNNLAGFKIDRPSELIDCTALRNSKNVLTEITYPTRVVIHGGRYTKADTNGVEINGNTTLIVDNGSYISENEGSGIVFRGEHLHVTNALFINNGTNNGDVNRSGIYLDNSLGNLITWVIENCQITNKITPITQLYGVKFSDGVIPGVLQNNFILNNLQGPINGTYPNKTYSINNKGFETQASGTSTILIADTQKTINYSLSVTPTIDQIIITGNNFTTNDIGHIWVSNITPTSMSVNVRIAPGFSNFDFGWKITP
jgi:hypothetical protein